MHHRAATDAVPRRLRVHGEAPETGDDRAAATGEEGGGVPRNGSGAEGDVGRAHRLAQGLEAGMIWVNSENNRHLPAPFGGMKASGIGRDGGDYSFEFYMETKNICIALDTHNVPRLGR